MLNKKIGILYKILLSGSQLNDYTLMENGLNYNDIRTLLQKKIIEPAKYQDYKLATIEKFRQYGITLLLSKHEEEAYKCFEICYELAPHEKNVCIQALTIAIKKHNYQKAYEIFSNLEKVQSEKHLQDNNLYLYLLSMIAACPEEYKQKVKELTADSLMLPNSPVNQLENEIRIAISQNKFPYACKKLNERLLKCQSHSIEFELLKTLLNETIECEKEQKNHLLNLVQQEEYEEIKTILENKQQTRYLSKLEIYILLIVNDIIKISSSKIVPKPTIQYTDDIHKALLGHNYKLALKLNETFIESINSKNRTIEKKLFIKEDIVKILLIKLNDLVSVLEEEKHQEKLNQKAQTEFATYEELAYYLSEHKISIATAKKKIGILHECTLMIKLIYARDFFVNEDYVKGNILLQEVEQNNNKTSEVIAFLEQLKEIRDNTETKQNPHTKSLTTK